MWTRRKALHLIKQLEPELAAVGWHCALTGGVLTKGRSDKDLDLVVYPHCSLIVNITAMHAVLERRGWRQLRTPPQIHRHWRTLGSYDEKHVEVWWIDGEPDQRVDIIYPVTYQESYQESYK